MKISDLIPDDKGKLAVYRWPDSDEFEVGWISRWDEHFIYIIIERNPEERPCQPQFVRLLQGQP